MAGAGRDKLKAEYCKKDAQRNCSSAHLFYAGCTCLHGGCHAGKPGSAGFVAAAEMGIGHFGLAAAAVAGHFDLRKAALAAAHVVAAGRNITGNAKIFHGQYPPYSQRGAAQPLRHRPVLAGGRLKILLLLPSGFSMRRMGRVYTAPVLKFYPGAYTSKEGSVKQYVGQK